MGPGTGPGSDLGLEEWGEPPSPGPAEPPLPLLRRHQPGVEVDIAFRRTLPTDRVAHGVALHLAPQALLGEHREGLGDGVGEGLARARVQEIPAATGIPVKAVKITIVETPMANWGIRGKIGDELTLNYKVQT